jgi:hypothetical protein
MEPEKSGGKPAFPTSRLRNDQHQPTTPPSNLKTPKSAGKPAFPTSRLRNDQHRPTTATFQPQNSKERGKPPFPTSRLRSGLLNLNESPFESILGFRAWRHYNGRVPAYSKTSPHGWAKPASPISSNHLPENRRNHAAGIGHHRLRV